MAAIVILAGIAVALWQRGWSRPQQTGGPPPAIAVTVAQPERRDVPIYLSAPGTVQAWNTVGVRSQIDGKLMSVNFVEGQEVRQGDILAQIDPSALKATLDHPPLPRLCAVTFSTRRESAATSALTMRVEPRCQIPRRQL